jgi:hypothetical protein
LNYNFIFVTLDKKIFIMKNFKKLSREDLRNVNGGRGCSVAIQGTDGTWVTRTGTCNFDAGVGGWCNVGLGNIKLTSNEGVSHCND